MAPLGRRSAARALCFGLATLALAGCRSLLGLEAAPTRSFVLSPVSSPAPGVAAAPAKIVGILPVSLPEYLERSSIVTRSSDEELALSSRDLWAEGLGQGLSRVLAENLAQLRTDVTVKQFPWRRTAPFDAYVHVDVRRFDGALGGDVVLDAQWVVYASDGTTVLALRRASFVDRAAETGYQAYAAAMSRAAGRLSEAIAETIPR
ncbi:MAG TPA: PqiC family protein [Myxococcota bacterium]|jgi:uncharacterized lipoprotein YmbA|nr:PqiC family protein [Myxococcota bacterium]